MMKGWIDRTRVRRICALIDGQIVLRTEQLSTFVQLKRSIQQRMVRGELRREDLDYIAKTLKEIGQ
jgi:hypothetical protein